MVKSRVRLHLPALPPSVDTLTNPESARLALDPEMPRTPAECRTCGGRRSFRWWSTASVERPKEDPVVVEFECPCPDQWVATRYMGYRGIGLTYQRLSWTDAHVEPEAVDHVLDYLDLADRYIRAGCGLILHGNRGAGKTMLAVLSIKTLISKGYDTHFVTFTDLVQMRSSSIRSEADREWFLSRVRGAAVLVIDDVGREFMIRRMIKVGGETGMHDFVTSLSEASVDEVLRHRVAAAKPTIITTNSDLDEIESMYGSNVISLLRESSSEYRFTGADWRPQASERRIEEVRQGLERPVVFH